jgi:hypothetical protein
MSEFMDAVSSVFSANKARFPFLSASKMAMLYSENSTMEYAAFDKNIMKATCKELYAAFNNEDRRYLIFDYELEPNYDESKDTEIIEGGDRRNKRKVDLEDDMKNDNDKSKNLKKEDIIEEVENTNKSEVPFSLNTNQLKESVEIEKNMQYEVALSKFNDTMDQLLSIEKSSDNVDEYLQNMSKLDFSFDNKLLKVRQYDEDERDPYRKYTELLLRLARYSTIHITIGILNMQQNFEKLAELLRPHIYIPIRENYSSNDIVEISNKIKLIHEDLFMDVMYEYVYIMTQS